LLIVGERLRKYRPDQPRHPSGRSDGGRWTSTDDSTGDQVQIAQDDAGTAIIASQAARIGLQVYNAWAQTVGFGEQTLLRARLFKADREATDHQIVGVEIVDQSEVQDFCPKYAEVKARLRIAEDQVKSLGAEMSPTQYGTAVHFALSEQINALKDDNFIAEKSFIKSKEVSYGNLNPSASTFWKMWETEQYVFMTSRQGRQSCILAG
jgi:hypothetical protein